MRRGTGLAWRALGALAFSVSLPATRLAVAGRLEHADWLTFTAVELWALVLALPATIATGATAIAVIACVVAT